MRDYVPVMISTKELTSCDNKGSLRRQDPPWFQSPPSKCLGDCVRKNVLAPLAALLSAYDIFSMIRRLPQGRLWEGIQQMNKINQDTILSQTWHGFHDTLHYITNKGSLLQNAAPIFITKAKSSPYLEYNYQKDAKTFSKVKSSNQGEKSELKWHPNISFNILLGMSYHNFLKENLYTLTNNKIGKKKKMKATTFLGRPNLSYLSSLQTK